MDCFSFLEGSLFETGTEPAPLSYYTSESSDPCVQAAFKREPRRGRFFSFSKCSREVFPPPIPLIIRVNILPFLKHVLIPSVIQSYLDSSVGGVFFSEVPPHVNMGCGNRLLLGPKHGSIHLISSNRSDLGVEWGGGNLSSLSLTS